MTQRMVCGGHPLRPEILGQTEPILKTSNFQSIFAFARSVSAARLSEKKFNESLIGSPLCAFQ